MVILLCVALINYIKTHYVYVKVNITFTEISGKFKFLLRCRQSLVNVEMSRKYKDWMESDERWIN